MLKIIDDVELKELEKFRFKIDGDEWYVKDICGMHLFVKPLSRKIEIKAYNTCQYGEIDVLYDLIQAGLVEKVKEE